MKIGVLGAGSWGTTLAVVLSENAHDVTLWAFDKGDAQQIAQTRENTRYLPGVQLHPSISITTDVATASDDMDMLVIATPTQFVRSVLAEIHGSTSHQPYIINVSKGIENNSLKRISEVVEEMLPHIPHEKYAALSGPSHAEEVSKKKATTVVAASIDLGTSLLVQETFSTPYLRTYSSQDVTGVELGGSLKNVIAIGAGICDGGGYGDNTKAALITRGIAEIKRLGIALGADPHTFSGLSGLGDLIVTTMSRHSRNRFVGEELGKGNSLESILGSMTMVAEGVETTRSAHALALKHDVEMPIIHEVYNILFNGKDAALATHELMTRQLKDETWS